MLSHEMRALAFPLGHLVSAADYNRPEENHKRLKHTSKIQV